MKPQPLKLLTTIQTSLYHPIYTFKLIFNEVINQHNKGLQRGGNPAMRLTNYSQIEYDTQQLLNYHHEIYLSLDQETDNLVLFFSQPHRIFVLLSSTFSDFLQVILWSVRLLHSRISTLLNIYS